MEKEIFVRVGSISQLERGAAVVKPATRTALTPAARSRFRARDEDMTFRFLKVARRCLLRRGPILEPGKQPALAIYSVEASNVLRILKSAAGARRLARPSG